MPDVVGLEVAGGCAAVELRKQGLCLVDRPGDGLGPRARGECLVAL